MTHDGQKILGTHDWLNYRKIALGIKSYGKSSQYKWLPKQIQKEEYVEFNTAIPCSLLC